MADHGTGTRYTGGCRCDECRSAHRVESRNIRDGARLRAQENPSLIRHGTIMGYTYYKCRCSDCRSAKAGRKNLGR